MECRSAAASNALGEANGCKLWVSGEAEFLRVHRELSRIGLQLHGNQSVERGRSVNGYGRAVIRRAACSDKTNGLDARKVFLVAACGTEENGSKQKRKDDRFHDEAT